MNHQPLSHGLVMLTVTPSRRQYIFNFKVKIQIHQDQCDSAQELLGFPLSMVVHKIKSDLTHFIEQAGTFYPNISCPGTLGPDGIICRVRSDRILLVRKDSLKQNLTIMINVPVLRSCLGFHSSWLCIRSNQIWHALLSKRELFIQNSLRNVFFLIEFTNRELSVTQCNTIIN